MALFKSQNTAKARLNWIITLVFNKTAIFRRKSIKNWRKWAKIGENRQKSHKLDIITLLAPELKEIENNFSNYCLL
jgi:hypothetical protein